MNRKCLNNVMEGLYSAAHAIIHTTFSLEFVLCYMNYTHMCVPEYRMYVIKAIVPTDLRDNMGILNIQHRLAYMVYYKYLDIPSAAGLSIANVRHLAADKDTNMHIAEQAKAEN